MINVSNYIQENLKWVAGISNDVVKLNENTGLKINNGNDGEIPDK